MEPASFPQFAKLPAELRCEIWRQALPRRIVHLRLRMDMDAWNWATEGDWWTHYLVATDPFPVTGLDPVLYGDDCDDDDDEKDHGPALLYVNTEARTEALNAYHRRLVLDPVTLQCCLEAAAMVSGVEEEAPAAEKDGQEGSKRRAPQHLLTRMCTPLGAPRFNARYDLLVWTGVRRWCAGGGSATETTGALFEGACRAAQHVLVEYDDRLARPLQAVAFAVADLGAPLRSLTLQTERRMTGVDEQYWRGELRVVPKPARCVMLRRPDATKARWEEDEDGDAATLLRRHHALFLPSAPRVPEGGCAVLAVVSPAQLNALMNKSCPTNMASFTIAVLSHPFVQMLTAAYMADQDTQAHGLAAIMNPEAGKWFHGFCLPEYGLP